jgi:hypothetical protein
VQAHGYSLYTSFSERPGSFVPSKNDSVPLYMVSLPGKKSHGLIASALKYAGILIVQQYFLGPIRKKKTYN